MKIEIYSAKARYGNGRLKTNYIEKLEKYKIQEIKYLEDGSTLYKYYIKLNDIEDIFNIVKELGPQLIIGNDIDGNSIMIYDDYIE